jgi:hypothetical protein
MQKWILGLITTVAVVLTGCGSTCDSLADADDALREKTKQCLTPDQQPAAFNVHQCERAIEQCKDAERDALDEYSQCLSYVEDCVPGVEGVFQTALTVCGISLRAQVGETCRQVFK